jgi:hypothetical protein
VSEHQLLFQRKTAAETREMLETSYGQALSPVYVIQMIWKNWRGMCHPCSVKLSTAQHLETAANVHELLVRNCQLTLKLVKDYLHVMWGIIFHILHDSFGARKICTKWIPHSLLYEHGVTTYEDLSRFFKTFHIILIAIVLRKIVGVSVPSSNIVSQHEVENEVITKVPPKKIAWKSSS